MIKKIKIFFNKTIKRQLIVSIVLTHALMMSIFIYDLTNNQREFLHEESLKQAENLSNMISKNATTWVLANDYIGMEELISSISEYPDLNYAMLLDKDGKVLAHTNIMYINKYMTDNISKKILNSKKKKIILINNYDVIDVATPIFRADRLIAWSRVSLLQTNNNKTISEVLKKGIFYTIIAIFIGYIFAYFLSIGLTKGLNDLIDVAKKQIKGQKDKRANDKRVDELGTLARQINIMLNTIDVNEQNIKEEIEKNIETNKLLAKSEQMASMGEMIGNIAHQWRQPLSVILASISGMQVKKECGILDDESLKKTCGTVSKNVKYLSKTIDDFTNFIKGSREKSEFLISDNINSFLSLVEGSTKDFEISIILDIDNTKIDGYYNELTQCFMNLYNNAKDALLDNDIKNKIIKINSYVKNEKLVITVQDNANGIPVEIISKIFEPYFTTKHKNQGTGLGLNMTYRLIVEGMSGSIRVKNEEFIYKNEKYMGALFTIELPLLY